MVADPALRIIVSPYPLGPVAGTNLRATFAGNLLGLLRLLHIIQTRTQNLEGLILILVLAAFILTFHNQAGRKVGYTDRRLGFVNMLPAGATRAKGVDLKVGWD